MIVDLLPVFSNDDEHTFKRETIERWGLGVLSMFALALLGAVVFILLKWPFLLAVIIVMMVYVTVVPYIIGAIIDELS